MAWNQEAIRTIKEIHHAGVLHKDVRRQNYLWNMERKRLMIIDFERSEVLESPPVFSPVSGNKRKRAEDQDSSHTDQIKNIR